MCAEGACGIGSCPSLTSCGAMFRFPAAYKKDVARYVHASIQRGPKRADDLRCNVLPEVSESSVQLQELI